VLSESVTLARTQFAENLRHHRRRLGLSQEKLAEICDLHPTEISLLERRKRSPVLETIESLARALELPTCELVEGSPCANHQGEADPGLSSGSRLDLG
jgi:transcriptional regulator with XRE-family HTH domain